jgi:uncharacterized protein YdhG (YjbR/CyaY superfamily)
MDDSKGLSKSEQQAVKERAEEVRKDATRPKGKKAERELTEVVDTIAAMPEPDRSIAGRLHEVITAAAPEIAPRLWYSQPAYAWEGKVLCFVRSGAKDEVRYTTLGFNDVAQLDDGTFWPTSFAVTEVTEAVAKKVAKLIEEATS